jgi:hypothetical protein
MNPKSSIMICLARFISPHTTESGFGESDFSNFSVTVLECDFLGIRLYLFFVGKLGIQRILFVVGTFHRYDYEKPMLDLSHPIINLIRGISFPETLIRNFLVQLYQLCLWRFNEKRVVSNSRCF